jgi:hypothetical protein
VVVNQNDPRGLTIGDSIAVIALLLFAIGWVALWLLAIKPDPVDPQDEASGLVSWVMLCVFFLPPTAAGCGVWQIIKSKIDP